jgi:hypothetical protein
MRFLILLSALLFLSCNSNSVGNTSEASCEKPNDEFKMYEVSEMAALMEQMYVENKQLKERIIKRDTLGSFPVYFLNIERAKLTKGKNRDVFFTKQADTFIAKQMEIYTAKDTIKAFNAMVDQCIACHEVKCGGPIARIKKLYIK